MNKEYKRSNYQVTSLAGSAVCQRALFIKGPVMCLYPSWLESSFTVYDSFVALPYAKWED